MTQVHDIRKLYFEEGKSITQISRESGHDRKTVRMCIEKENWNDEKAETQKAPEFPKLDPFKADIDEWLTDDKKAKRKQRHTAKRVYVRLVKKYGDTFDCSYRTVAGYVSKRKEEIYGKRAGHLPLEHIPGEAQADFGDAEYYENGRLYGGKYLNVSFPYSNKGYFQLFKGENQECLFEGLALIFEHIGGVPQRIWFDNTSTIVTKVLKNGERNLTNDFLRFMAHYRFEAAFCNVEAGHEKGSVEAKVGYHRRNMLVPIPRFQSLSKFNKELLEQCEIDAHREHYRKDGSIEELYTEDYAALLGLPAVPLDVSRYTTVKTNEVIPVDDSHREIIVHERFYGDYKQQSMKWLPYLTQLSRCPGALKYTGIYQLLPESVKEYLGKCTKSDKGKVLQVIAKLTDQSGFEGAVETVDNALKYDAADIDSLINLHSRIHGNVVELAPIRLAGNIPELVRVTPNLAAYDASLGKAGTNKC